MSGAGANPTVVSLYARYRLVSQAMQATYIGPTVSDGGVILVGQVSGNVAPSAFNGLSLANTYVLLQRYKTFPLREGCKIVWNPLDVDDTSNFFACSSATITVTGTYSTPWIGIWVYGAASNQATLLVNSITNYEGAFQNQNFLSGGTKSSDSSEAVPGWFEKCRQAMDGFEWIFPFVRSAANSAVPMLGTLANGLLSAGLLSSSNSRPRFLIRN